MTINEMYNASGNRLFWTAFTDKGSVDIKPGDIDYYFQFFGCDIEKRLTPHILRKCGHFKCVYTTWEELFVAICSWSVERAPVWNSLLRTTVQSYELTHNYDRTEVVTEKRNGKETVSNTTDRTINSNGRETISSTVDRTGSSSGNSSGSTEHVVSAFDSPGYHPGNKDIGTGESSESSTSKDINSGERVNNDSRTGKDVNSGERINDDSTETTIRAYGNIGVTTAQQMLEEERKLVMFSVVNVICDDFKKEFCIALY